MISPKLRPATRRPNAQGGRALAPTVLLPTFWAWPRAGAFRSSCASVPARAPCACPRHTRASTDTRSLPCSAEPEQQPLHQAPAGRGQPRLRALDAATPAKGAKGRRGARFKGLPACVRNSAATWLETLRAQDPHGFEEVEGTRRSASRLHTLVDEMFHDPDHRVLIQYMPSVTSIAGNTRQPDVGVSLQHLKPCGRGCQAFKFSFSGTPTSLSGHPGFVNRAATITDATQHSAKLYIVKARGRPGALAIRLSADAWTWLHRLPATSYVRLPHVANRIPRQDVPATLLVSAEDGTVFEYHLVGREQQEQDAAEPRAADRADAAAALASDDRQPHHLRWPAAGGKMGSVFVPDDQQGPALDGEAEEKEEHEQEQEEALLRPLDQVLFGGASPGGYGEHQSGTPVPHSPLWFLENNLAYLGGFNTAQRDQHGGLPVDSEGADPAGHSEGLPGTPGLQSSPWLPGAGIFGSLDGLDGLDTPQHGRLHHHLRSPNSAVSGHMPRPIAVGQRGRPLDDEEEEPPRSRRRTAF